MTRPITATAASRPNAWSPLTCATTSRSPWPS